jgi:hypothetical protein
MAIRGVNWHFSALLHLARSFSTWDYAMKPAHRGTRLYAQKVTEVFSVKRIYIYT